MPARKQIKKVIQWSLMLLLAFVLLYFAFRGVKWADFMEGVRSCDFRWIAVSMAASILAFVMLSREIRKFKRGDVKATI